ncbi:MAG: 23S rRNA (adenine(2503)-C(2))-methyltransferase RlmN [Phycisphaerales bacterium]
MALTHPDHHIFEHTPETLAAWCVARGMPKFRAGQILEWVYEKGTIDPAEMSNLSKRDRDLLSAEMTFLSSTLVTHRVASDGTQKLLLEWQSTEPAPLLPVVEPEGDSSRQTESVMIPSADPSGDRRTACISSQVGCPVGCRFCASGLGGLDGNLSAGRIVEQVWRLCRLKDKAGQPLGRISNVVFMGMGEPLANFGPVTRAIRTLNALWATGISARKITISTVGLPSAIEKLSAEFELPVTLALSLHAPTDEIRRSLIPWAEYSTIESLLAACQRWFDKTGREITLEYTLLDAVNTRPEHAEKLAALARTLRANVNLIRYNEVAGLPFGRPADADVTEFQRILKARGINTHIRASRGRDIAAACGQLRHEHAAR